MWRAWMLALALLSSGCVAPTYTDLAPDGCTTLKITGNVAVARDCGVPRSDLRCRGVGSTTFVPYAGEFETLRCTAADELEIAAL